MKCAVGVTVGGEITSEIGSEPLLVSLVTERLTDEIRQESLDDDVCRRSQKRFMDDVKEDMQGVAVT